jgi:hypothetical protein
MSMKNWPQNVGCCTYDSGKDLSQLLCLGYSMDMDEAMPGLEIATIPREQLLAA